MGFWDRIPGIEFDSERRIWPMKVRRLDADGTVLSEAEGRGYSLGEREGTVLAEKLGAILMVTGYDGETDSFTSVLSVDDSDCVVLRGSWGADEIALAGDDAAHLLGFDQQRLRLEAQGPGRDETVEIALDEGIESFWDQLPNEAPPPTDDLLSWVIEQSLDEGFEP